MQSISVAQAKNQLTMYLKLVEQGENVEITRHGKPVAYILQDAGKAKGQVSPLERSYNNFRKRLEALSSDFTDRDWRKAFDIKRTIHKGPRHREDFE